MSILKKKENTQTNYYGENNQQKKIMQSLKHDILKGLLGPQSKYSNKNPGRSDIFKNNFEQADFQMCNRSYNQSQKQTSTSEVDATLES